MASMLWSQEENIDVWDNKPLGPTVPVPEADAPPRTWKELKSNRVQIDLPGQPVVLVEQGQPRAAIIIPAPSDDQDVKVAERAAKLLQEKVYAASKACLPIVCNDEKDPCQLVNGKLKIVTETEAFDYAVFIGENVWAARAGVTGKDLPEEGFRLQVADQAIYIVGNHFSVIYAIIDLLEQYGFRSLWPGELGTVTPKLPNFTVKPMQVTDAPALNARGMRSADTYVPRAWRLTEEQKTWFTAEEMGPYDDFGERPFTGLHNLQFAPRHMSHWAPAKADWTLWHRVGGSQKVGAGHSYGYVWEKYGQEHLDYFALLKDGSRHPRPRDKPQRVQLCFSKPEVIEAIANDRIEALKAGAQRVSLSPSDGGHGNAPCMCVRCRRLDVANAAPIVLPSRDPYVAISDRHFHCFNLITEKIIAAIPGAKVGVIAYSQYRDAPLRTQIHPELIVGFVGFSYHDADYNQSCREQWNRWANKTAKLYWRPNVFYGTKSLLAVYAKDLAADMKRMYQTGMIGTDITTFSQDWSTLGLNYYMAAKMLWNPAADPEEIIMDYCQTGFERAATEIRQYFAEVEKISTRAAQQVSARAKPKAVADADNDDPARGRLHWGAFSDAYSPADFARLHTILDRAEAAAQKDDTIMKRIDFLRAGLKFTAIRAKAFDICFQNIGSAEERLAIVNEQYEYFKTLYLEYPWAINVAFIGWWDHNIWRKQGLRINDENNLRDK